MRSFIFAIAPMFLLFLIPVLIPIVAVALGTLADLVRPPRPTAAEAAVTAARARSAPWRAEMQKIIAATTAASERSANEAAQEALATLHDHATIRPGQAGQRPGGRIAA